MGTNATVGGRPFGAGFSASQQVSWFPVHEFVQSLIAHPEALPIIGTPAWQNLDDSDPDKALACIAAAPHYALALDTRQAHLADASKQIAAAANWAGVARNITRRESGIYIPRRKAS